jgi:hypothetical protein
MLTVTAIIGGDMRYPANDDEIAELVRVVFAEPRTGWAVRLFAWHGQGPYRPRSGSAQAGQMRVVTDLRSGWGAVNFLRHDPERKGWHGWNSLNPDLPSEAPELPFGRSYLAFPQSASIRLDVVMDAVREYCHRGERPRCLDWQEGRYF